MDDAVKHLTRLLRSGAITPQTNAEGLSALRRDPGATHPDPTPATAHPDRRERPIPVPRGHPTAEMDAYIEEILSQMPDERPILRPRRRRPIPAPRQLVFCRTRWVIGSFLQGWQMDVPQGHPHGADPRAFLEGVRPQIRAKLEKEIKALNGIKFQLALKVQLRKDNPDGSEKYTDPVLSHKQEAILQNSEIEGPSIKFPPDPRNSGEVDAEKVRLGCRSSGSPLTGHRQISATKRRLLHSTTGGGVT